MLDMIGKRKETKNIKFVKAKKYSAYMELAMDCMNENFFQEDSLVEINPYYRYHQIVKELFRNEEYMELKETLLNLIVHINFKTDCLSGMNKREFYRIFFEEACAEERFGEIVAMNWRSLNVQEKYLISNALVEMYQFGNQLAIYKCLIKKFYKGSYVYVHQYEDEEILVYTGVTKNNERIKLLSVLQNLFVPIQYNIQIYWKNHFGIIDIEETMVLDQLELY